MKLQLGLGLGTHRKANGGEPYVTPVLPEADSIIRAWSTRRLIPAYKNNTAIKADRTDPLGGDPDDGFLVPFRNDGTILIPNGYDAYAYELHEQHGIAESKLINTVFANCPKVLESNIMKKGLDWSHKTADAGNSLYMAEEDPVIETVFSGSFSLIVWAFIDRNSQSVFYRTKTSGSGTWDIRSSSAAANTLRCSLSAEPLVFTPAAGNTYYSKWASFGFVVNRAPEGNVYAVYLNGISIGTGNLASPSATTDTPLRIGGGFSSNAKAVNDLAIWDTALSDSQMKAAHDAMAPYYT